jgi:small GTP-binding protein
MGLDFFSTKKPARVIFVGLDNSGKSSVLHYLQGNSGSTAPTVGFGKEEFKHGEVTFEAMDMSGQSKYRNLWASYSAGVDAVVFVVDATDRLRFKVAKD